MGVSFGKKTLPSLLQEIITEKLISQCRFFFPNQTSLSPTPHTLLIFQEVKYAVTWSGETQSEKNKI